MTDSVKDLLNNESKFLEIAKTAFESVDTDKSGEIDLPELEQVMAQLAQEMGSDMPSKEDVKEVFEFLDTDHSGTIDFQEFSRLIRDLIIELAADEDNEYY